MTGSRPGARDAEVAELVRAIGHEVGNQLAAIRLAAHLQGARDAAPDSSADIEETAGRAGVLLALIRPLLQEPSEAERAQLGAEELLAGLSRTLEDHRKGRERLRIAPTGEDLPVVRADPDAVHHAFVALVLGALEASAPDGEVRVAAGREGDDLRIAIEDGAAPVVPASDPLLGRVLDLRLAEAVVRRDGGRCRVDVGRGGTRVELTLPGRPASGAP